MKSYFDGRNIDKMRKDFPARLKRFLEDFGTTYEKFVWRAVLVRDEEGRFFNYYTETFPVPKGKDLPKSHRWDYENVTLVTQHIPVEGIEKIFSGQLFTERGSELQEFQIQFPKSAGCLMDEFWVEKWILGRVSYQARLYRHGIEWLKWPHWDISIDATKNRGFRLPQRFIHPDHPYFPSEYYLGRGFFEYEGEWRIESGEIHLYLPTFEFRFTSLVSGESIEIKGEFDPTFKEDYFVVVDAYVHALEPHRDRQLKGKMSPTEKEVVLPVGFPTNYIDIAACHPKDKRLIDARSGRFVPIPPEEITPTFQGICIAANRGEGIKLDYTKEFKTEKIMKELAAFANTEGGIVLVGVDDSGEIIGVETTPQKAKDDLTRAISDNFDPPISFTVESVPLSTGLSEPSTERRVLVIYTPESQDKPVYYRKRRNIYIRANATSRPARRDEIIDLVSKRSTW